MHELLHRARRVYRTEGLIRTIEKSIHFILRYIPHLAGKRRLYGSQRYRNLLFWWNSRQHSAVADPFKIIHVDPALITRVTGRGPNPGRFKWRDIGKVQGGNWDKSENQFEILPVVQALRQRFDEGKDWDDIEFIRNVIAESQRGHVIWRGCASDADVRAACAQVDELYEAIQNQGYLSKQELLNQNASSPNKYVEGDGFERYDEVLVDIGRDGEFLFVDGRHRLAIAKILDVDVIPVRISARHTEWQGIRETVAETPRFELSDAVEQYLDHPDLSDVLKENRSSV